MGREIAQVMGRRPATGSGLEHEDRAGRFPIGRNTHPGVGRFAQLNDPLGAALAIFQPAPQN